MDVEVITYNNRPQSCLLERLLKRNGQPHVVLGREIAEWNHGYKHSLNLAHLSRSKYPYTLALDGFDVVYHGDLSAAVRLLGELDKDWIFNGDHDRWPAWPPSTPRPYSEYQERVAAALGTKSPWRYINAGAWIAKTDYALEVVRAARLIADDLHDLSEQKSYHYLFPLFPRMGIDYECRVFQTELRFEMLEGPRLPLSEPHDQRVRRLRAVRQRQLARR